MPPRARRSGSFPSTGDAVVALDAAARTEPLMGRTDRATAWLDRALREASDADPSVVASLRLEPRPLRAGAIPSRPRPEWLQPLPASPAIRAREVARRRPGGRDGGARPPAGLLRRGRRAEAGARASGRSSGRAVCGGRWSLRDAGRRTPFLAGAGRGLGPHPGAVARPQPAAGRPGSRSPGAARRRPRLVPEGLESPDWVGKEAPPSLAQPALPGKPSS